MSEKGESVEIFRHRHIIEIPKMLKNIAYNNSNMTKTKHIAENYVESLFLVGLRMIR